MKKAGHPTDQAIAAALDTARKSGADIPKKKKKKKRKSRQEMSTATVPDSDTSLLSLASQRAQAVSPACLADGSATLPGPGGRLEFGSGPESHRSQTAGTGAAAHSAESEGMPALAAGFRQSNEPKKVSAGRMKRQVNLPPKRRKTAKPAQLATDAEMHALATERGKAASMCMATESYGESKPPTAEQKKKALAHFTQGLPDVSGPREEGKTVKKDKSGKLTQLATEVDMCEVAKQRAKALSRGCNEADVTLQEADKANAAKPADKPADLANTGTQRRLKKGKKGSDLIALK